MNIVSQGPANNGEDNVLAANLKQVHCMIRIDETGASCGILCQPAFKRCEKVLVNQVQFELRPMDAVFCIEGTIVTFWPTCWITCRQGLTRWTATQDGCSG